MHSLFYKVARSVARCYHGWNLWAQLAMCALTYILVMSGFDWWYLRETHDIGRSSLFFSPALVGFLMPLLVPLYLLIRGYFKKDFWMRNVGLAVGQAALLGLSISTFYKMLTGRMGPHGFGGLGDTALDISNGFRFGFLRGGAFQGWPSSHTTTAFAMSFALVALFPKNTTSHRIIRISAVLYAFYIGIGVSTNIHWFSDFAAGAILGAVIGLSVGKTFLDRYAQNIQV